MGIVPADEECILGLLDNLMKLKEDRYLRVNDNKTQTPFAVLEMN